MEMVNRSPEVRLSKSVPDAGVRVTPLTLLLILSVPSPLSASVALAEPAQPTSSW